MKWMLVVLLSLSLPEFAGWGNDFEKAKEQAQKEHKFILLNFSGSDWCGPCIRLKKEIFQTEAFNRFADEQLVLVNADFPRARKNQLSRQQQTHNDQLAEQYNSRGSFPLTLLLSPEGKVLKTWEGFPGAGADHFLAQLKESCLAAR